MTTTTEDTPRSPQPTTGRAPDRARDRGAQLSDDAADAFRRWQAGDDDGLDRLVRLLSPLLWHLARAYRLDEAGSEDAVQATWLSLVRSADSIRDPQAVLRWLTVTVRRHASRAAASAGRMVLTEPEEFTTDSATARSAAVEPGPEDAVVALSASSVLWAHVALLSQRCQQLLRVVAFSEHPDYAELSRTMSMPVGSIGPTRRRCLAKLQQSLGNDERWEWS